MSKTKKNWKDDKPKTKKYRHSGLVHKAFEKILDQAFDDLATDQDQADLKELECLADEYIELQKRIGASIEKAESFDYGLSLILEKRLSSITNIHLAAGVWELKSMEDNYYFNYFQLVKLCVSLNKGLTDLCSIVKTATLKTKKVDDKDVLENPYFTSESIDKVIINFRHYFGRGYKADWEKRNFLPQVAYYLTVFLDTIKNICPHLSNDSCAKTRAAVTVLGTFALRLEDLEASSFKLGPKH